jgi:hypothetical protein
VSASKKYAIKRSVIFEENTASPRSRNFFNSNHFVVEARFRKLSVKVNKLKHGKINSFYNRIKPEKISGL